MPLYKGIRDLGAWDAAFRGALADDDDASELGQLLLATFEFGSENLYGNLSPQPRREPTNACRTGCARPACPP